MKNLSFEGKWFEYFKIWIVNAFLTIITLGFYYPWAKVRTRRYFYANTLLDDRNFEYHATGRQLIIGFLIVMGFFITYNILGQVHPGAALVLFAVFLLAFPWIIWRSMKFNYMMTSYSNVRFSFMGSLGQSYIIYLLLPIVLYIGFFIVLFLLGMLKSLGLIAIILGTLVGFLYMAFAFAYVKNKSVHYVMNGSRFGQGVFATDVQFPEFFKISLKTTIFGFVTLLVVGAIIAGIFGTGSMMGLVQAGDDPLKKQMMIMKMLPMLAASYVLMIFAMLVIMAYSTTRQRRYVYANTKLDDKISFASTLDFLPLAWVTLTNLLAILAAAGIGAFVFTILKGSGLFFTLIGIVGVQGALVVLGLLSALIALPLIGMASSWGKIRMARLYLANTQVDTAIGFEDYVSQKQNEESSLGEQMGDAFNVDVGIGF